MDQDLSEWKDATSRQYPLQKKISFHHLLAEIKREKLDLNNEIK
jgi:hypothetical protein